MEKVITVVNYFRELTIMFCTSFSLTKLGATQFALAVKSLEKDDPEIASLNTRLRSYFIPPMIPTASLKPNDQ